MNVISFCQPCLKFKVVGAIKLQFGWPGFSAPHHTRYRTRTCTFTRDDSHLGYSGAYDGGTGSLTQTFDRATGAVTTTGENGIYQATGTPGAPGFLENYGFDPGYDYTDAPGSDPNVTVSVSGDASLTKSCKFLITDRGSDGVGYALYNITVTLSDEYSLTGLEADADAIIASVDVGAMPWNSLQYGAGNEGLDGTALGARQPEGLAGELFPFGYIYSADVPVGSAHTKSAMEAVAWSGWGPGDPVLGSPNTFLKAVGHVQMIGQYCLKTYPINWDGTLPYSAPSAGTPSCANGQAGCSETISIAPPGITTGATSYVRLFPGGRC